MKGSLSHRFNLALIIAVAVVLGGFASLLIAYSVRTLRGGLATRLQIASQLAARSLPGPLWNVDYEYLTGFSEMLLVDDVIVYVNIRSTTEESLAQEIRPGTPELTWEAFQKSPQFLTQEVALEYENQPVGSVRLAVSTASIRRELIIRITAILALTVILIVVIALTSILMTRRLILRPLAMLVDSATQIAAGEINEHVVSQVQQIDTEDEVGLLAAAFRKMTAYLHTMTTAATQISMGDLRQQISPQSERDILGNAFQQMVAYLNAMGVAARQLAQGDLQHAVTMQSPNDQLGAAFVDTQRGLSALIAEIQAESDLMTAISAQVLDISAQNSGALNRVNAAADHTAAAMVEMRASSQEMRLNMEQLTAAVEETGASIKEISLSIQQVAENSKTLAQFADSTGETVLVILSALQQIAVQAEQSQRLSETATHDAVAGHDVVSQVIESIRSILDVTAHLSATVAQLHRSSDEIGVILDVIHDIAGQTALLSLNASIIAAQAGEHGRGFAVVAGEIKELAARVATATKQIGTIVRAVQANSNQAVDDITTGQKIVEDGVRLAQQAGDALAKIEQSAEQSATVTAGIATLVRQQTITHADIARSIQDVAQMIAEITRATQEQKSSSIQLFTAAENMQGAGAHVLQATQEQQLSAESVSASMEEVLALVSHNRTLVQQLETTANELADRADRLRQQITRFRR
jgi:methyl-accepting chemotaxis protein